MENKKYARKNLYLGELKYYDADVNGIPLGEEVSLVVLSSFQKGDETIYYNVLNEGEVLPTFGRTPYGQYDSNGEQYGTMLRHIGGKLESGPCWLIRHDLTGYAFDEEVTIREIEDGILESEHYFKDRKMIAERRRREKDHPLKMIKILRADKSHEEYMNFYFEKQEQERQKTKK